MTPLRTLLTAVAVVAATAVPASASTDFEYTGGCAFDAVNGPDALDGQDVFHGVLYGYAVLYSLTAPAERCPRR